MKGTIALSGLVIWFCIVLPSFALGQPSTTDVGGYLKYLSSVTNFPGIEQKLLDQEFHGRVNMNWYPSQNWSGSVDAHMWVYYGGSVEHIPDFINQVKTQYPFSNLDAVLWNESRTLGYAQIDRLWMDYSSNDVEITLGRQRIAWGTALVWNVIDLFNPKSVLDFDYEQKPGSDAARIQYYTGPVSKGELVVRPGKSLQKTIVAGAYNFNKYDYDFFTLVGIKNEKWFAGGAWAGSILDGGFRGEALVRQIGKNPTLSAVLSGDYTFPNSLYIHSEILFNSNGHIRNAGYFQEQSLKEGLLSPARWSCYQEFAYDITPLVRSTLFGIFNPDDHSLIVVPMLSYSMESNLELLMIGLIGMGSSSSEYGSYGKAGYLRLKFSF